MFMRWRGVNIDSGLFDLRFTEPQNFAQYRQADIDMARINTFTQLEQVPYLSKRFIMKRYLGLSEAEMTENETMWAEEQGDIDNAPADSAGLRSVGITPGGITSDLDSIAPPPGEEGGMPGMDNSAGAASPTPGAGPAGGQAAAASIPGPQ
jgi:hypothetical protein